MRGGAELCAAALLLDISCIFLDKSCSCSFKDPTSIRNDNDTVFSTSSSDLYDDENNIVSLNFSFAISSSDLSLDVSIFAISSSPFICEMRAEDNEDSVFAASTLLISILLPRSASCSFAFKFSTCSCNACFSCAEDIFCDSNACASLADCSVTRIVN